MEIGRDGGWFEIDKNGTNLLFATISCRSYPLQCRTERKKIIKETKSFAIIHIMQKRWFIVGDI